MFKSELDLDPWQDHAGIAYDDDAAAAGGVELTRWPFGKATHAYEVMVIVAQSPGHAAPKVSCVRPVQELSPSVWTSHRTHVEPLTTLSPRGQVFVDEPFRPSKVLEGHGFAVLDVQLAPVADVDAAPAGA